MRIQDAIDQVGKRLQAQYGNSPIPRQTIVREVQKLVNCSPSSIIPSDFCYNRENAGSWPPEDRIFLMEDPEGSAGLYTYVGKGYKYDGPVVTRPRK